MNKKISTILLTITGFFTAMGNAVSAADGECNLADTETEMYECIQYQLEEAESALNQAYKGLIERYQDNNPSAQGVRTQDAYLKEAQQAWSKFRDESCHFETYESIPGSGFETIYAACLLDKTQERLKYLQWYLNNP